MSQTTANLFGKMSQISSPIYLLLILSLIFPSIGDKFYRQLAGFTQNTQEKCVKLTHFWYEKCEKRRQFKV